MSIKNRLNEIKDLKFKKIKDFSDAANLSYRTAQNYLSGEREPNLDSLNKICTHLGVNLNWLIVGIGQPFLEETEISNDSLNDEEKRLINNYRAAKNKAQQALLNMSEVIEKNDPV